MVSDAHDAVSALDWVHDVQIVLQDHHDADRINRGVAAGLGFSGTYPDEAAAELDALRRVFRVKAHTAFIERVCTIVVRDTDWEVEDLGRLRIRDLPAGRPRDGLCRRRLDLGMSCDPDDLVMVDEFGEPWPADRIPLQLRFAKSVRISIDGNAHFCRGLLRTRYPDSAADQSPRAHERVGTDLGLPAVLHSREVGRHQFRQSGRNRSGEHTMRAVQVVEYHKNLEMRDVPEPEISGPLDVIVRIGGAGVCRTDLHVLEGQWAEKSGVTLPYTIGHENAGWVHAVGVRGDQRRGR